MKFLLSKRNKNFLFINTEFLKFNFKNNYPIPISFFEERQDFDYLVFGVLSLNSTA